MAYKIILLLLLVSSAVSAGEPLQRKILALYDAANYDDVFFTALHQQAEMPLNYLGMELVFRDVNAPLPSDADMSGYRGVITWFSGRQAVNNPQQYCDWATHQMQAGRKLVILGRLGVFLPHSQRIVPECQGMLKTLGIRYLGDRSESRFFFRIAHKNSEMVEFERRLDGSDDLLFAHFRVTNPKMRVHLRVERTDIADVESTMVVTGPNGGFAYESYVIAENRDLHKMHWRINPYLFFEEAFDIKGWPRPDPSTMNGSRIFYSHIDGDGIFNVSHIDQKTYSGEVILNDILRKYPDIPVAASIIAGYLDLPQYTSGREMTLYRDIFNLPNIEPTAHGYAHPLIWKKKTLALKIPGYTYNTDMEVRGAVERVRGLLAQLGIPKAVTLYQWTGDCLLPPEALESAEAARVLNMNGGDTRFDRQFDSYAFVYPLSIVEGGRRQVYISGSNENTYTNLWEGPFYGYANVVQTFDNTESPHRVKPVNIYYHYYSGERQASLQALKKAYDYARSKPLLAIWASEWPRIVDDFFGMQIIPVTNGYQVKNGGWLRTIRLDGEKRNVNMAISRGVVGYLHDKDALYVSLDEGKEHFISLTPARPSQPYLMSSTFKTRAFRSIPDGVRFEKLGWMKSRMMLGGMKPNATYTILAGSAPLKVKSNAAGQLSVNFPTAEMGRRYQEVILRTQ